MVDASSKGGGEPVTVLNGFWPLLRELHLLPNAFHDA